MARPVVTAGAVANLIARMNALGSGSIPCAANDLVNGLDDSHRVERVRVVVPGAEYAGQRYGGAETVRGMNLPNARPMVRIRAL
jgi:hypothetical protein